MTTKKGFTLIEILVVVLIIGILAAIAVPQYQKAVDKSNFLKYQAMVKSLSDAYDEHMLRTGHGTKHFEDLSFSIPSDFKQSRSNSLIDCVSNSEMFCCMSDYAETGTNAIINCGNRDLSIIYSENHYNPATKQKGHTTCFALPDNVRANRVCSSLGTFNGTGNSRTPDNDWYNTYNGYIMN